MSFKSPEFEKKPDSEKHGIDELFKGIGESFNTANEKAALEYSHRIMAVEAGLPIKPGDLEEKEFDFLKREQKAFSEAFFKGKSFNEIRNEALVFKLPEFSNMIRKNEDGGLLQNLDLMDKYKWAVAMAPLEKMGIRDFRKANEFEVKISASGRIYFKTELKMPHEQFSYDAEKLFLAAVGESRDGDKEFTIAPYAHTDQGKHVNSKSLLILNNAQREIFRKFITENIQKKL